MTRYALFLRAVNVGGTGKLPMADLARICTDLGFSGVRTYIASGNVAMQDDRPEADVRAMLEAALAERAGLSSVVAVRTLDQLRDLIEDQPFKAAAGNRVVAMFYADKRPADAVADIKGQVDEEIHARMRELIVHFPSGQAGSKLKFPKAEFATGRNMNTVVKMAALLDEIAC